LPPEAQSRAIDNIATRVESVISELKTEGKSTEFIAALQSGVKEMKEQLKQGREPGIDLKSLVTDALAAADIKATGTTDIALDKQLNQISNILAAATSLNQTSQQQNYLNTGLNEVQGIKEFAQQQIESTRLVQQSAANDKGVNIFKPEGQHQLTEKIRWMVNSRNITAEIRLDPPDLGGMNIKVNLAGDSASVSFVVQSQHARDALDQAVPRLREMLEEHGIELGQSSVQQESAGSNEPGEEGSLANNSNGSDNLAQQSQDGIQDSNEDGFLGHNDVIEQRISGGRIGGIDYYA
jgi:flagellar hook-length control protein FliK